MNAQDLTSESLMIGDWVYVVYDGIKYIAKVEKLDYDIAVICNGIPDDWEDGDDFDDIEPIPLTPEILEKNGFVIDKEETNSPIQDVYKHFTQFFKFPLGKGFYIEHDTVTNDYWITDHCFIRFNYLHEFQHVLKLCKIEKTIEL